MSTEAHRQFWSSQAEAGSSGRSIEHMIESRSGVRIVQAFEHHCVSHHEPPALRRATQEGGIGTRHAESNTCLNPCVVGTTVTA
jgi:hypothetical protein